MSYPDYVYFRDHNEVFSGLAAYDNVAVNLRIGSEAEIFGVLALRMRTSISSRTSTQTVGLPLLRGRLFNHADRAGAPAVAVISEVMACRFWPGEDPIGKRLQFLRPPRQVEIVGVVRDGRFRNYRDTVRLYFYIQWRPCNKNKQI